MPAPIPVDRNQPSFLRFPIQNDRTGFKPVSLPVILVVPWRRDESGRALGDSGVYDVKYFIAEAPDPAKVAGPFNVGILVPPINQFVINVNPVQLNDHLILPGNHVFRNSSGDVIDAEDAEEGDVFEYTLIRGEVASTIPYYPDADYYDLSNFIIDVEDLPRPKRYLFVWQAGYKRRVVRPDSLSSTLGSTCINAADNAITQFKILINHPGEVHNEMFRKTPPLYFENAINNPIKLSDDKTLEFYRPFADLLQDIFDEQFFLDGINQIDKIPAQLIPYLAYLIGWDLPNFPGVTDEVRRSVLRQAVHLQQLKGSKRVIVELFDIFGFTIDIINLWFSTDGTRLIGPAETLPNTLVGEEIKSETRCQIDPVAVDFSTPGFGEFTAPLVFRATGDFTISAFLVKAGPTRDVLLQVVEDLTNDPTALESQCQQTVGGTIVPQALLDKLPSSDPTLLAMSEVHVDYKTGKGESTASTTQIPLINTLGVTYDGDQNVLSVNFDHYLDFVDGGADTKLFLFATYPRTKITVPPELQNLRSNRFDVRILLRNGDTPDPTLFEFLMNFVFKLKGFHSLLRKIIFRLELIQAYNVQDFCFGAGSQLQVPPAIIPDEETEIVCGEASKTLGYKQEDLDLRDKIFNSLLEDFRVWKALDNTHGSNTELEKYLNLPVSRPVGGQCQFTRLGQDRVANTPDVDLDQNPDERATVCDERPPLPDNCFKGRVKDELDLVPQLVLQEIVRCRPCGIGMGSGYYWLFPSTEFTNQREGFGSFTGQNKTSFLGRQISRYGKPLPQALYYSDRPFLIDGQLDGDRLMAYRKPSLEVDRDTMGFPGHRFITMNKLLADFVHPLWRAKPWDSDDDLNAELVTDSEGDEVLVFDDKDLVYKGNGLEPDISSLGIHDDRSFLVTHKVYMSAEENHPAITLDDRIVLTQETSIELDSSKPFGPLFKSYNSECNQDYISGYPAETDRFDVDFDEIGFSRGDSASEALAEALELPVRDLSSSSSAFEALFTLGSQILLERDDPDYLLYAPLRLDCECARFVCGGTGATFITGSEMVTAMTECGDPKLNLSQCHLDFFQAPDGTFDFNCDQLDILGRIKLTEKVGVCSRMLDGSIPNMLCILTNGVITDLDIPPEGKVHYKDDYGIIYDVNWVYVNNVLDILTVTKQPNVWGEPDTGYVSNRRVFRRGIITSIRQIIRVNDGGYELIGEGVEQKVDYFQSNALCGDEQFVDNFCFHLDCYVTDQLDFEVICGPRWVRCDDDFVEWPSLVLDSAGNVTGVSVPENKQSFEWIDVWNNDESLDVTGKCLTDLGTEDYAEVTYSGDGGLIPQYDDGSGVWPTVLPFYPFISEIEIDADLRIVDLVSVDLKGFEHSFSGDLHAVLLPPNQECPGFTIFHRPGSISGSFGNFGNFDGDYKFIAPDGVRPVLPSFGDIVPKTYVQSPGDWPGGILPLGSFSDVAGLSTRGKWRLLIIDWAFGDSGTLESWSLTFRVACSSPNEIVNKR